MKDYKNILLGVELISKNDDRLLQKALEIVNEFKANLYVVHAIEHLSSYGAAYGVAVGADIEQMLMDNARKELDKLGRRLNLPEKQQILKMGPAQAIILEEAEKLNADLIVIGSHGRHGLRLLLGSTANAILHGAKCDVLAVRLQK